MKIGEVETRLREKERELLADMTRTEVEARAANIAETQNVASAGETKDNVFQETTLEWDVFTQVRDALQRIQKGIFGKCVECGCQIEDHRLESVPWTPYCLNHQKQHERDLAARQQ